MLVCRSFSCCLHGPFLYMLHCWLLLGLSFLLCTYLEGFLAFFNFTTLKFFADGSPLTTKMYESSSSSLVVCFFASSLILFIYSLSSGL